jgi:hypothetical protein
LRRNRRHVRVPPDLTSLFDVLFIVIFAALIRAAAVQQAAAKPAPPAPPVHLEPTVLQQRAAAELSTRPTIIVRVSGAGEITALEQNGKVSPTEVPLVQKSADPDVALGYLGDRDTNLHVCHVAATYLRMNDLAQQLVIIAVDRPLADLPHALYEGLRRDVDRCWSEQHGLAVIVDAKQP